jgi:predicted  nucleic acid-binding Zn-ribbon protein
MSDELEELKQMRNDLDKHIQNAATQSERKKLSDLQSEVDEERQKVRELETKAYEVAIQNKSKIKTHLDEAERLRLESLDISMDAWELQSRLKSKQTEMYQLQQVIKDSKNLV